MKVESRREVGVLITIIVLVYVFMEILKYQLSYLFTHNNTNVLTSSKYASAKAVTLENFKPNESPKHVLLADPNGNLELYSLKHILDAINKSEQNAKDHANARIEQRIQDWLKLVASLKTRNLPIVKKIFGPVWNSFDNIHKKFNDYVKQNQVVYISATTNEVNKKYWITDNGKDYLISNNESLHLNPQLKLFPQTKGMDRRLQFKLTANKYD
jgi:hypothetical protein